MCDPPGMQEAAKTTDDAETKRLSRAALSKTAAIPEYLTAKYVIPADTIVHHTVHKDSTLPLFQGKLCGGEVFEGKSLEST